jgi:acyl-coenzyme A synthetase/AMP-(fatty) acid ligase
VGDPRTTPERLALRESAAARLAWAVHAFVAERTAPYKRVRQVEFIEAVPKSASGKILRRKLRAKEKAGS